MKGLELARAYFTEYGKEMLQTRFQDILQYIAAGLVGSGSECFGFDDDISRDHDFEPGFCIFIPGEDIISRETAFKLERAYAKLPVEFNGIRRNHVSPVGGSRHGIIKIDDFYLEKTGTDPMNITTEQWLTIPEYALFEATNGEIFLDNYGLFTKMRNVLLDMPEDIRRKRLAGNILIMAQSGQYNFRRCLDHGETGAAQLAVTEFVKSTMRTVFLLNNKYMPYYKWSFRAMRNLPKLSILAEIMEYLITTGNDDSMAKDKYFMIEDTAGSVIEELMNQNLTKATCGDLEKHAYSVNDSIADADIRNRNILCCIGDQT